MTRWRWHAAAWSAEALAAVVLLAPRVGQPWSFLLAFVVHAAAAGLAVPAFGGARREERFFRAALVAALPGVGLAGLGAVAWWLPRARPATTDNDTVHASLAELPGPEQPPESLDRVFEWVQTQLAVQPLADVIRSGDPKMQGWAIHALGRRDDSAAVDLLREALHAEDRSVQIAASTTIQKIEERLTGRINRMREATRLDPSLAAGWAALGEACRAYQQSRLLEPVMERHWLAEAEGACRHARALEPDRPGHKLGLARVLLAAGQLDEAAALARETLAATPSADVDRLLAEILFARRAWAELRATCRAAVAAGRHDELLDWWARESDEG